ncbi:MAG: class I SAM-dependent methyltransferase [Chitinophagaceae bacterium]
MKCKICGNTQGNETYHAKETMFGFDNTFEYIQCASCGCLQIVEIPANMADYYPREYYSFVSEPSNYKVNALARWFKKTRDNFAIFNRGILGKIFFKISPNGTLSVLSPVEVSRDSRILDVGCGSGIFLHTLRELGFKHLKGIDPYLQEDIRYKNGLTIDKKGIHEQDGQWDLIMLHHAFEHIPDQLETMEAIQRLLAPGGICLIRIPIVSSYAWEHYKTNWIQLDAPRHFFLHSIDSLKLIAGKAGMEVAKINYDSDELQFMGSEQFIKGIPLRGQKSYVIDPSISIFTNEEVTAYKKKAKELNEKKLGDQAAFYLKKKGQ